jgi:hypothetical protein
MKTKNALNVSGGNLAGAAIHIGDRVNVRVSKESKRPASYPEGCIGANLAKRNYVKYLVERYNHFREAEPALAAPRLSTIRHFSRILKPRSKPRRTSFLKVVLKNWWIICITGLTTQFQAG